MIKRVYFILMIALCFTPVVVMGVNSEEEVSKYLNSICSTNGGVNCSLYSEPTIICNDGTKSNLPYTVYMLPQCQETIDKIAREQSDFMAETLCFPPAETLCINDGSYKKLSNFLKKNNLVDSELGKEELIRCQKEIEKYKISNLNYRKCLAENNNENFEPMGRETLPLLKTIFCPIIYGKNSSYNAELEMCSCNKNYFLNNNICVEINTICQNKHGKNSYGENGNCYCKEGYVLENNKCTFKQNSFSYTKPENLLGQKEIILDNKAETETIENTSQESKTLEKIKVKSNTIPNDERMLYKIFKKIISGISNLDKILLK
jgi:hypothetical protein